ncbi:HAD family hydrolase, partial [Mycobacterium tuberculosis variant microti]
MDVAHLMAAAVLFDIDGVLVLSWRAIPGAAETVRQLTHRGIACAYLTNTTTRTRRQIAEALGAAGIPVAADDVITAGVLTAEYLHGAYPGARCFLVNNGDITEDLPGIDVVL